MCRVRQIAPNTKFVKISDTKYINNYDNDIKISNEKMKIVPISTFL